MKARPHYSVEVFATGLLVLVLFSLPLFWARRLCKNLLVDLMPLDWRTVNIELSRLVPDENENDPNVFARSHVHSHIIHPEARQTLGISHYFSSKIAKGRYSHINLFDPDSADSVWACLDDDSGQFVFRWTEAQKMPDGTFMLKKVHLYVGPEGVSEIPNKSLGRFSSVVVDLSDNISPVVLYDQKMRRFFAIDHSQRSVTKGPQLPENDPHRPIDIGLLNKKLDVLDLFWLPTEVKRPEGSTDTDIRSVHVPIRENNSKYRTDQYSFVLDASGRIDLLDNKTLEFVGTAGHLPAPQSFFPSKGRVQPEDLIAYRVFPLALGTNRQYRGLFVASVGREGTDLALAVFDHNGILIAREDTRVTGRKSYRQRAAALGKAIFWEVPGGPMLATMKFLFENLHPPILSLVSYFTASTFEAGSGHRALFLLPNSFIAMKGRDSRGNIATRFISALLLIIPSILFAIWLACRVRKDTASIGFSRQSRFWWTIGTIAFGLPAYITYRLTKPKITLVTCANCGKLRRLDMEKCHQCNSPWEVLERTAPNWRVLDK